MIFFSVFLGGGLGALLRYTFQFHFGLPWTTLGVNLLGALIMGAMIDRLEPGSSMKAFLIPGLLGGFTTFSGFALDSIKFENSMGRAILYITLSVVGSLVLCFLGYQTSH